MDIGEVLTKAWKIIWKHKILWIFGILAGCAGGGGGGGGGRGNVSYNTGQGQLPPNVQHFFSQVTPGQIALMVAAVVLVMLILIVILVFLGTIGRIGLIRGTQQADQGAEHLSFGELFKGSLPYFWRVFLLSLLVGIAIFIFVLAVTLIAIMGAIVTFGFGLLCCIPLFCLMVPAIWAISLWVDQASIAIVIENLGILDGMNRGWEVIKTNAGTMVIMWLILILGLGLIGGTILALPFIVVFFPVFISLAANNGHPMWAGLLIGALCLVAYLPFFIVLGGILRGYIQAAWTLTFMRLTTPKTQIAEPAPLPEPEPVA